MVVVAAESRVVAVLDKMAEAQLVVLVLESKLVVVAVVM